MCQSMSPHALTEESACTFFQSIVSDSDPQEEQNFFRHACVIHIYELFFNLKSDFDALQLRVIIFKDLIWPHRNTGLVGLKLTHLHDLHLGHFESKRCKNIVNFRHTTSIFHQFLMKTFSNNTVHIPNLCCYYHVNIKF